MTRTSDFLPYAARASTARMSSPPVTAEVVVWPEGKDQPEACVAQSAVAGRGRATRDITPYRTACAAARQPRQPMTARTR